MKQLKNVLAIVLLTFLTIMVAACSQPATGGSTTSNSTTSSNTTSNSATSSSTASSYDNSGYYGNTSTSTPGSSSTLKVATTTIKGASTAILTDAQGKTLYYFTPDSSSAAKCLSNCTPTWPPLLATASSTPTLPANSAFTGTLSALDGGNGKQLQYNGHFLYTFSGDKGPGDTNGQGIAGKWFVVTPNLK